MKPADQKASTSQPLLAVRGLRTEFQSRDKTIPAVDDVSFDVARGECLGVVGESGSGKSVTALSIMGLIQAPGKIVAGEIRLDGQDLVGLSPREMQKIRGNKIAMIFQEPMTSLNPVFTVGNQIEEALYSHQKLTRLQARRRAAEMLELVGIPDPEERLNTYPHQMSGGMRQRVMIAMALCCKPQLLIADEPTTALDVTIQAQILELISGLRKETGTSVMLITHDLGVVAELADRVMVMYAGRVVEKADVLTLFDRPGHPYTEGLLRSVPRIDDERHRLEAIEGMVPNLQHPPPGCRFEPRCPYSQEICRKHEPPLFDLPGGGTAACWRHTDYRIVDHAGR